MSPPRFCISLRKIFSATVRSGSRLVAWYTVKIPSARASRGLLNCTCRPPKVMVPLSAGNTPERMLMSVDFPAPLRPTSAWISASASSNATFFRTGLPTNDLLMLFMVSSIFDLPFTRRVFNTLPRLFGLYYNHILPRSSLAGYRISRYEQTCGINARLLRISSQLLFFIVFTC